MAVGVPSSAALLKRLNVREWDCLAVHEKAALWVMGASRSEGHTTYMFGEMIYRQLTSAAMVR